MREQTRRDAEELRQILLRIGNGFDLVPIKVEDARRFANAVKQLQRRTDWRERAEQAERERDEARQALEATRGAAAECVPPLVTALRRIVALGEDDREGAHEAWRIASDALTVWEQE